MGRGGSKPLLSPNITGNVMPDISVEICDIKLAEPRFFMASACFNKLEEVKDSSSHACFQWDLDLETTLCFYISR